MIANDDVLGRHVRACGFPAHLLPLTYSVEALWAALLGFSVILFPLGVYILAWRTK